MLDYIYIYIYILYYTYILLLYTHLLKEIYNLIWLLFISALHAFELSEELEEYELASDLASSFDVLELPEELEKYELISDHESSLDEFELFDELKEYVSDPLLFRALAIISSLSFMKGFILICSSKIF